MTQSSIVHLYWIWPSPVGALLLVNDGKGLCRLQFQDGAHPLDIDENWKKQRSPFSTVIQQLKDYFAGRLQRFSIPLSLEGTEFQRSVWHALKTIPYGKTVSYGAISEKIGNPRASRAVGAANGQNPCIDHCALPSGYWINRKVGRLRRRVTHQNGIVRIRTVEVIAQLSTVLLDLS